MNYFNLLLITAAITWSTKASANSNLNIPVLPTIVDGNNHYSENTINSDEEIYVLDTIIAKNDGSIVLKYRTFKANLADGVSYRDINNADFNSHEKTINNHPTLNKNNSESAIKSASPAGVGLLLTDNNGKVILQFQNPLSEVVFIGFKEND